MYSIQKFENGFEYLELSNAVAKAKIALQGAHLFEYSVRGKEDLLWLSPLSRFEEGVAIRGGVPLCWPRFGSLDETMMQHGFARLFKFKVLKVEELNKETTLLHMRLSDSKESRELWDHLFELDVVFKISDQLEITLMTKNLDTKPFIITQALHTYFKISDIANITIKGLQNCYYIDTLRDEKCKEQESITIDQEIDRVYIDTDDTIELYDKRRHIRLKTEGSASTVVWNPWQQKCSKMSYMPQDAYREFVCIESANAFDDFIRIGSKKSHTLHLTVSF